MNFEKMILDEILNIVNLIMDNLMDASTNIEHARHTKDYTHRLRDVVTKVYLQKVCEQYQSEKGCFAEREMVTILLTMSWFFRGSYKNIYTQEIEDMYI